MEQRYSKVIDWFCSFQFLKKGNSSLQSWLGCGQRLANQILQAPRRGWKKTLGECWCSASNEKMRSNGWVVSDLLGNHLLFVVGSLCWSHLIYADRHSWQVVTGHLESMREITEEMNDKQISRSDWMHQHMANSNNNRTVLCPCWRHSFAVTCRLAEDILLDEQVPALRTTLAERLDNTGGCIRKRVPKISDSFRPVPNFCSITVVLCSIFSEISWYLWSQTSQLSNDSIFFAILKVCIFQATCPFLVAERRYDLADSCVILACVTWMR